MSHAAIDAVCYGVTILGLVISWALYRRRGAATALRGVSLSLVPAAAALTNVTGFFLGLAFNPIRWLGVGAAGLAAVLYLTSGAMLSRRAGGDDAPAGGGGGGGGKERRREGGGRAVESPRQQAAPVDPDLADIEEILRNRGIK
ncbi:hypothetical protein [Actinomadura atramentaria]|uniref:hypothetical protein n=1 Tax=Actinomadura atramentaria TaxID=1990 RepID=UPI00037A4F98|nr:hypothetical protein [Actinomadura atramentaria]